MKKMKKIAGLILFISFLGAKPLTFKVDPPHTTVLFSVSHMMLSKVKGTFEGVDGVIRLDTVDLGKSSAEGIVKVATLNTRNTKRDSHLLSADFFDAKKFPEMKMVINRVYKKGSDWWAEGKLTIKDVTKKVSFPFELVGPMMDPWGNLRVGIHAEFKINRFDYGVSWNKALEGGGLVVGKNVGVELNVEAVHPLKK